VVLSRKSLILQLSTGELFIAETGALFVVDDLLSLLIKLQINFLPDLMQVKFLPDEVTVTPTFLHAPPTFTAAFAETKDWDKERKSIDKTAISLLIMSKA